MNKLQEELYNLVQSDATIFEFIQDVTLDGLWYWNLENPTEGWINDTFWKTLGYDPVEMSKQPTGWMGLINPDDLILAKKNFEKHLADPNHDVEQIVRYTHKNGSLIWIKIKGFAIRDEQMRPVRMLGVHINVNEEKRNEMLLMETNRIAKIGSWEVNLIDNTVFWSPITKEIHEVAPDFVPDVETGINFYKEGESRTKIIQCLEKAIADGTPWDVELQLVTATGKNLWVRAIGEAEFFEGKCIRLFGVFQDIDEKVRSAEEHIKILERLKLATDAAQIGIWDYDVIKNELIWDEAMYQLYGVKKEDFSGVYEAWTAGVHPDDWDRSGNEFEEALAGGKPFNTQFRVVWPDGTVRHIRAIATIKRDEEGKGVRVTGVNWDITDVKERELKLRESEERFRQMFENAPVGIGLVDLEGNWTRINKSFTKITGFTEADLVDNRFEAFTYPEDKEKSLYYARKIVNKEINNYQIEKRYYHKDGHVIWVIIGVSAVQDELGNNQYFIAQIADISEEKRAERVIIKERAFLQTLIDSLPVNVFVKDLDSRKTLINRKELEHMGVKDVNEVLGKSDHDLYPKWSADISRKEDLEVFESGQSFIDVETENLKKNGERNWFLTSKIPLKDDDDVVTGLLGISYNITKYKLAEEKLRQLSILESKSKEMEQFAYIASHDLREPLLTIRGYSELLEEDFADKLDDDGLQILGYIQKAVNRMDALIHGLLDYSRLSKKKELEEVNVENLMNDVLEDLTAVIKANDATFEIGKMPTIIGYPLEVKLLFQNLLSNAIKFKQKENAPRIEISAQKVLKGWQFSVKDNGIGIRERSKEKIFNLFSRLHSKDAYAGTGIGLANCKKIAELHNGEIWVESTPGKGSIFYFTILTDL